MVISVSTLVQMILPVSTLVQMVLDLINTRWKSVDAMVLMSKNDCEMNRSMAPDLEPWIGSSTAPINLYIVTLTYFNCLGSEIILTELVMVLWIT